MARDKPNPSRDSESKRNGAASSPRDVDRAAAWSPRRGRSGYGMESIRPHLRAQLEQQRLLRPTFPPSDDDDSW
jgi:hypothetical protein